MKKVLFILSNMSMGGAERVVSNLTLHLPKEWSAQILLNDTNDVCFPIKAELISLGLKRPDSVMHYGYQLRVLCKRYRRLRYYKKHGCYDAYISLMDSSNLANLLSTKKGDYCTILSLHNTIREHEDRMFYRKIVRPLLNRIYKRADFIVTVSKEIEEQVKEQFPKIKEKVVTINNGYDMKEIQKLAHNSISEQERKIYQDNFVIASMGRLTAQKGQWHLIRAFSRIAGEREKVNLVLIGEGEKRPYLEELIRGYHLENRVFLLGNKENPFSYLQKAGLFVMPSMYEGFPNALAEAMCCELPCLVTDFKTGAREFMCEASRTTIDTQKHFCCADYGVITKLCDGVQYSCDDELTESENMLADALEELISNEGLREQYKKASAARVKELDIANIVKKWERMIGE